MTLAITAVLSFFLLPASAIPTITWASEPVQPGETLLLAGDDFDPSCSATLSTTTPSIPSTTRTVQAVDGHATSNSLKFLLPSDLPADVFALNLTCASGSTSTAHLLNTAQPWWVQGDAGDTATPGGWLRVSGLNVAWLSPATLAVRTRVRESARAIHSYPPRSPDFQSALTALIAAESDAANTLPEPSYLMLTPCGGGSSPLVLQPVLSNATQFSVFVPIPSDTPPGCYNISASNGRGVGERGFFSPMDSFTGPETPHTTSITIVAPTPWPSTTVRILNCTLPMAFNSTGTSSPLTTSDGDVAAALATLSAAGGGTLAFGPGTFFLALPIILPPYTALVGAGAGSTVLQFAEYTPASAPPALIALNDTAAAALLPSGTAPWAVKDLSIVVTAFHYHVIAVSNFTDGWALERVTMRANAFFAGNNAGTVGVPTHGRFANWTLEQPGNGIQLNAKNFRILSCDLWTSYNAITSFASNGKAGCNGKSWPNSCHGATYGWIADNVIRHGGASHFMNQMRQIIYERNVAQGASVIAMGNAMGTGPDGGYDHHVLHADNIIELVWGNDRELLTYDDAGGAYFGTLSAVNGATLTTSQDTKSCGDMTAGGWAGGVVVVLNGTGAGQWRRIVTPGIGPEKTNPGNRTWVVDSPFTIDPQPEQSWVQFTPFRGRNIFSGDLWRDGGAVQYYGQALDNIMVDTTGERMTGFLAWGQWRGWVPPNRTAREEMMDGEAGGSLSNNSPPSLKGQMGNGVMPNLRNQYLRNSFQGAWSAPNYNYSTGYDPYYARRFFAVQPLGNTPEGISGTFLLVYRGNAGGGGYFFGTGATNVVVDGGEFSLDPGHVQSGGNTCVVEQKGTSLILVTGLQCSNSSSVVT